MLLGFLNLVVAAVILMEMCRVYAFALLAFFVPGWLGAQAVPPPAPSSNVAAISAQSAGVLIGLDRVDDPQIPHSEIPVTLEDRKSAAYDRQWKENNDDSSKPVRFDTTPEESPYATIWLQWTPAGPKVQMLKDIILPRKDGFWRFGINHSSTKGPDGNDQDFFWITPLGKKPALTHAEVLPSGSESTERRLTFISPDIFSYREFGQSWGGTYGEGEYGFVRSLDSLSKAPLKESDYNFENPGLSLAQALGPGVDSEFKKITAEVAPKDSEDSEPAPATDNNEDADPCADSGFRTFETDWYLTHRQGEWVALLNLHNSGAGVCNRQSEWRPLAHRPPAALAGRSPIPVPWAQVEKAFPGARHAFASPKGDWLVVLTHNQILLVPLTAGSIGKPAFTGQVPYGIPVMSQWALGRYVGLWDQQLAKLSPPNDKVFFTGEPRE